MDIVDNIIEFENWCNRGKYSDKIGWEDPCNDCLGAPVNQNSEKPIHFEEKEKEKKK